jgi:hypothetical protein
MRIRGDYKEVQSYDKMENNLSLFSTSALIKNLGNG